MTDSIQSAPHLAFTIYLVDLNPKLLNDDTILLNPRLISRTTEVERGVIKLEISRTGSVIVDSSVPEKESKGSQPILSEEEYLSNIEKPEFVPIIRDFWYAWRKRGGDLRLGTVGFTAGFNFESKRIPIQYVYQRSIVIVSERYRSNYNISDKLYDNYKNFFKKELPHIYDKHLIGNHVEVKFTDISSEEFEKIISATFLLIQDN